MRPSSVVCLMLAMASGLGSRVDAQSSQRPAELRPAPAGSPQANFAQPGLVTRAAPPVVPPEPNAMRSEPAGSGLGDAAWTSSPVHSQSRGQSPAPLPSSPLPPLQLPPAPEATTPARLPNPSRQVVPAQFTSGEPPGQPAAQAALSFPSSPAASSPVASSPAASSPAASKPPRALRPPTAAIDRPGGQSGGSTLQMVVSVLSSLGIVIGLIVGAGWCYRKAAPKLTGTLPKQAVQILGRTQLAPRQQLVLIRFGSKLVLVSNLQGEVRTLGELTDPLEVDQIAGLCESAQPGSISESFRSVLHNMSRNGT